MKREGARGREREKQNKKVTESIRLPLYILVNRIELTLIYIGIQRNQTF